MPADLPPRGDGLARSAALLRAFRLEQSDPPAFYGALAADSVRMLARHTALRGTTVVDVGAGPDEFAAAFVAAGARYVAVDADPGALRPAALPGAAALVARGEQLPLRTGCADVAFASNVFEHTPAPEALGEELLRVLRPGGVAVVSYTNWLSPWGGHETSPFHYLGAQRAAARYTRRYGRAPKNRVGVNLHKVSVARGLRWARTTPRGVLVEARPRYYPRWASPLVRVPGLREVACWNLWLVLRRR